MALWIKALLWIGVVLLPGGLLLIPVLIAFRERDRRARRLRVDGAPRAPARGEGHEHV